MRLYGINEELVRTTLAGPAIIEFDDGNNRRVRGLVGPRRWLTVVVARENVGTEQDDFVITLWEEEDEG